MSWEVDWSYSGNTGTHVWARNPTSHIPSGRDWHLVGIGYLKSQGINVPIYRTDSWQVDWTRRNGKLVWAYNPMSKMPSARKWHWVDFHTLQRVGIPWKPKTEKTGRYIDASGYVTLTRRGMTAADIELAKKHGLFRGKRLTFVKEHQLVALKKYSGLPPGTVVRHINGEKTDNRPENLVLGSIAENNLDHDKTRRLLMYWKERALIAEAKLAGECSG